MLKQLQLNLFQLMIEISRDNKIGTRLVGQICVGELVKLFES